MRNEMLTLPLAGLKSLKIVNEIDESFLLKVCETVRNRVADAGLQDRRVHPDDLPASTSMIPRGDVKTMRD